MFGVGATVGSMFDPDTDKVAVVVTDTGIVVVLGVVKNGFAVLCFTTGLRLFKVEGHVSQVCQSGLMS